MTRTTVGTDDSGDNASRLLDYGLGKYEDDQGRRAAVREAKRIARDAVRPEKSAGPDPRSLPPRERRRANYKKR